MSYRQFIWGLSNGIMILSMAGLFWFSFAASGGGKHAPLLAPILAIYASTAVIFWAALRLRRKANGFRVPCFKDADAATRKIIVRMRHLSAAHIVVSGASAYFCWRLHRIDLLWPLMALNVSLQFVALAQLFHVRAYSIAGIVGTALSLIALGALPEAARLNFLCLGMGTIMWVCAAYLLFRADKVAAQATHESVVWA